MLETDSSSCPDCGMDAQDVPHLFNCTAHPTDMSPVNLWDKPVNTIRYDTGTELSGLAWTNKMMMVEEDIQQQQSMVMWW